MGDSLLSTRKMAWSLSSRHFAPAAPSHRPRSCRLLPARRRWDGSTPAEALRPPGIHRIHWMIRHVCSDGDWYRSARRRYREGIGSLPMPVAWSGATPLLVDTRSGSVYLPSSHGQVVVARYAKSGGSTVLGAGTAVVLAHSALASFLPFTNQDPPFITPDTFLLSATPAGQIYTHDVLDSLR